MGDRQAEETGKAQGLDPLILRLKRAAKDFGPHVDAKRRLHRRPPLPLDRPGQGHRKLALMRPLRCLLQDRVQCLIRRGQDRCCMGGNGCLPACRDRRAMGQKRLFPDQPDGEQVGQRGVTAALQLGLPEQPAGMHRPAAEVDQQAVERGLRRLFRQAQPFGSAQDGAVGGVGGFGDMGGKVLQPGNFRRQVMRCPLAPGGKRPLPPSRRPQRLPPVKEPCGPQAKAAGNDRGPVGAGGIRHQVRHRGQRLRRIRRLVHPRLQPRQIARFDRLVGRDQRRRQVVIGDLPACDLGHQVRTRQGQTDPRHPRQPRGSGSQILTRLAQERVHRNRRIQRKRRGDRPRRCLDRLQKLRGK